MARILCIEDDPLSLQMLHKFLETGGHDVLEATDGGSGVILAARSMPDLILMDINLPHLNGLDATRRLKALPSLARVPVIAVTVNVFRSDRESAFEAGCDAFLPKPLLRNALLQIVADTLNRAHSSGKSH